MPQTPQERLDDLDGVPVYTVAGLAKAKGQSTDTIYDLLRSGQLVGFRKGIKGKGSWGIREDDWEDYLERRRARQEEILRERRNAALQAMERVG